MLARQTIGIETARTTDEDGTMSAYLHISGKKRAMLAEDDRGDVLHALVLATGQAGSGSRRLTLTTVTGYTSWASWNPDGCFCSRLRDKKSASSA